MHPLLILAGFTLGAVIVYVVVIAALSHVPRLLKDGKCGDVLTDQRRTRTGTFADEAATESDPA